MSESTPNVILLAAKAKLRFRTKGGHISTEDLFDLSLKDLDAVAVAVSADLKQNTESFLTNPDTVADKNTVEQKLRLDVLKEVIAHKETENREKRDAAATKARITFLENLLEKKRINDLESLPTGDIEKELAELRG
jgi:hypothetical protein